MAIPFFSNLKRDIKQFGAGPLFVDTIKGLPQTASKIIGQPSMRAYAGLAGVVTGKPLTPKGTFQEELYGTNKPITLRSVGEEVLPEGNRAAPVLGAFFGLADLVPGGKPVKQSITLLSKAKSGSKALLSELQKILKQERKQERVAYRMYKENDELMGYRKAKYGTKLHKEGLDSVFYKNWIARTEKLEELRSQIDNAKTQVYLEPSRITPTKLKPIEFHLQQQLREVSQKIKNLIAQGEITYWEVEERGRLQRLINKVQNNKIKKEDYNKLLLESDPVMPYAESWLYKWAHSLEGRGMLKNMENPPDDVVKLLDKPQFKPSKPIFVYRATNNLKKDNTRYSAWTQQRNIAENFGGGVDRKMESKFVSPDEIFVEVNKLPKRLRPVFDEGGSESEVILKPVKTTLTNKTPQTKPLLPAFKGFKDLTTKFLDYAKGKTTLSRQEIQDFARRPELKKSEADLLLKKLEEFEPSQSLPRFKSSDKEFEGYVNSVYDEFSKNKTKILSSAKAIDPNIIDVRLGGSYGKRKPNIDSDIDLEFIYNGKPPENLYEKLAGQFELGGGVADAGVVSRISKLPAQEFAESIRRDLFELKPVKVQSPQYHSQTLRQTSIEDVIEGYEEIVFESPIVTNGSTHYPNSKNYFAHARGDEVVENGKKIWREQEIQSDLLQKEGLENLALDIKKQDYQGLSGKEITVEGPLRVGTKISEPTGDFGGQITDILPDGGFKWADYDTIEKYKKEIIPEKYKIIQKATKKSEIEKLLPFTNNRFGERIMRERIKAKAQAGYSKYRLPTGETVGKIEGFQERSWVLNRGEGKPSKELFPEDLKDLKVGMIVNNSVDNLDYRQDWIITDVLGDGRFKAVQKSLLESKLGASTEEMLRINPHLRVNAETFDLTSKSNPQYRRYTNWGKFLKNKLGGKEITDPQGNTWVEVNITGEEKKAIPAFGGQISLKALFTGAGIGVGAISAPLFIDKAKELLESKPITYNRKEDYIPTQKLIQEQTQVFREIPFTEETIKQTTASIMSEISNRMKPIEVSAMLHVAINKAKQEGITLEEVISDPNFFQGVTNQRYQDVLNDNIEGQDVEIKKFVKNTIDKILSGEEKDHTKGATHFVHITNGVKKDAIVTMTEEEFTTYLSKKGRNRDLFAEALLK